DLQARAASAPLKQAIEALETEASALEGSAGGFSATFLSTPAGRSLARLNSGLGNLLTIADTADAAPTTQQLATFKDLQTAQAEQMTHWNEIKSKNIVSLNQQLKAAKLPQ